MQNARRLAFFALLLSACATTAAKPAPPSSTPPSVTLEFESPDGSRPAGAPIHLKIMNTGLETVHLATAEGEQVVFEQTLPDGRTSSAGRGTDGQCGFDSDCFKAHSHHLLPGESLRIEVDAPTIRRPSTGPLKVTYRVRVLRPDLSLTNDVIALTATQPTTIVCTDTADCDEGATHASRDAVPPPSDDEEESGGLTLDEVGDIIRGHWSEVKSCYEKELVIHRELAGQLKLRFRISAEGTVVDESIVDSTMGKATMEACILTGAREWKFPKPRGGGYVQVNYPFVFVPEN